MQEFKESYHQLGSFFKTFLLVSNKSTTITTITKENNDFKFNNNWVNDYNKLKKASYHIYGF